MEGKRDAIEGVRLLRNFHLLTCASMLLFASWQQVLEENPWRILLRNEIINQLRNAD